MLTNKNNPNFFKKIPNITVEDLPLLSLLLMLLWVSEPLMAQSFDLPTVTVPGVTNSSSATEIIAAIIKYGAQFVLWALVLVVGVVYIKNTVKCVAKVRRDEEGKWGEVMGEIIGGALVVILVIALATWVTSVLN